MHPRLTELLAYLEAQRARVLAAAATLPRDRWAMRPSPDQWSVAEVYFHLHRVERGVAKLIGKRVGDARAGGHPAESEVSSVLGALDGRGVVDRTRRMVAPLQVSPQELPDPSAVQFQLEESRTMLRAALAEADGLALGTITHVHPVLGEIDLYQWILFVGQHEERHLGQIADVVSAASATSADGAHSTGDST